MAAASDFMAARLYDRRTDRTEKADKVVNGNLYRFTLSRVLSFYNLSLILYKTYGWLYEEVD